MSEQIIITIVTDDEKLNTKFESQNDGQSIVTHDLSATVMSTLLKENLIDGSFCGGRGDCGRCKIQFLAGAPMPTPLERSVMEPDELRRGYRLACLARPKDDCVIKLALADGPKMNVITEMIDVTENDDQYSQQNKQTEKQRADVMKSEKIPLKGSVDQSFNTGDIFKSETDDMITEDLLIAVDLGTTTIAMQLMGMESGRVVDTYCEMNPQRRYGADVLSRIKASCDGSRGELQRIVVEVLERGVVRFEKGLAERETARRLQTEQQSGAGTVPEVKVSCKRQTMSGKGVGIRAMCIAGNTTMTHLLMGYDVSSLGCSPFTPVETGLQEYRHPAWDFKVWLVPCISAFVGGDIVAGLYALDMLPQMRDEECAQNESEERRESASRDRRQIQNKSELQNEDEPQKRQQVQNRSELQNEMQDKNKIRATMLIDLGTNGEMAITDGRRMIVTATAAGPAFEGGAGAGVVGSDMVACTASLLKQGVLDETGLLAEPYFTTGVTVGNPAVRLCNKDIRDLQMAKAAVRAGVEILWRQMGEPQIGQVYLAGGFGNYLDVEAAFAIGLLPEDMRGRVRAAGNTSLAGAFMVGRDLWKQQTDQRRLERRLSSIESINLAKQADFEKLYLRYMHLG